MEVTSADVIGSNTRSSVVAPWWHTVGLLVLFVGIGIATSTLQRSMPATEAPSPILLYVPLLTIEWILFAYVWFGLRSNPAALRAVVGSAWTTTRAFRDVAFAACVWLMWTGIATVWDRVAGDLANPAAKALLPHGVVATLLWVLVAASAGFVEEAIFRGYFLRQFAAWTRSVSVGVIAQAVLFGLLHGYQGSAALLRIIVYGALLGALAVWRGSTRPGMIAHAWTDIAAAFH